MRSLYSTTSGNPDLRDELGRTFELGASYTGWLKAGLNLFSSSYRDLITSIRQPDGTRKYVNIGQARIKGMEIETGKSIGHLSLQVQYTYLDAWNITDNRKLDLVPNSQLSFMTAYTKPDDFSAAFWVIGVSQAQTFLNNAVVAVPSYLVGNLTLEKYFKSGSFFIRVENLFNKAYFTEPGYPVTGRRIEIGFGLRTGL